MSSDSGGKLRQLSNLFSGCFGKRKTTVKPFVLPEDGNIPKRWIKLPKFKDAITPYTPRRKKVVPRNDSFTTALRKEQILATGSTTADHPILNICLGFKNEELAYGGPRIVHRSYKRTQWDRILFKRKGLQRMASYSLNCNEPIVDDLPASLWMQCLEPTLSVLIQLSAMKHRRTNLSQRGIIGRSVNATVRDSRDRHGDHTREVQNFLGPQLVFRAQRALAPTEEVRPSRILEFGGPSRINVHVMVEPSDRTSHRNGNRNILTRPARDPYEIEEDEPLAYILPEDAEESDLSTDISSDESDFSDDELDYMGENFNINASTNYANFEVGTKHEIYQSTETSEPVIHKTPITKPRLRSYFWYRELGGYVLGSLNTKGSEDIRRAQNYWVDYIRKIIYDEPINEESELLHCYLSKDPAYRRLFLNDIVVHIEHLDRKERKAEAKKKAKELRLTSCNERVENGFGEFTKFGFRSKKDSSSESLASSHELSDVFGSNSDNTLLFVRSVSDVSLDDLPPLPDSPVKLKHLQCEDYVICNVIPSDARTCTEKSDTESVDSIYLEDIGPFHDTDNTLRSWKNELQKHRAVVVVTDEYVMPPSSTKKSNSLDDERTYIRNPKDEDDETQDTSILSLYA